MLAWVLLSLFAVLVALFAGQNTDLVVVRFLGWEARTLQALVILASAAAGGLVVGLISLPHRVRMNLRVRSLQNQVRTLRDRLEKAEASERRLGTAETPAQESGASPSSRL